MHSSYNLVVGFILVVSASGVASEIVEDDNFIFVTPSQTSSSYHDSPNSVTSLDADLLDDLGIVDLSDALRLVPGMVVNDAFSSRVNIGYHGLNANVPRRTQVLFNSNKLYRAGYADMNWVRSPFDINDLEKIEVVRGSSVVEWGDNAFSSTVNLVPEPLVLKWNTSFSHSQTTNGKHKEIFEKTFNSESMNGSIRLLNTENDGYDESDNVSNYDDSYKGISLLHSGEIITGAGKQVSWFFAGSRYDYRFPEITSLNSQSVSYASQIGAYTTKPIKEDNLAANITVNNNSSNKTLSYGVNYNLFSRAQDLTFCYPAFAFDPILAELDKSENIHLSFQDADLLLSGSISSLTSFPESIIGPLSGNDIRLFTEFLAVADQYGRDALTEELCLDVDALHRESRINGFFRYTREFDYFIYGSKVEVSSDKAESDIYLAGSHTRNSVDWTNTVRIFLTENSTVNAGMVAIYNTDFEEFVISYLGTYNYSFSSNRVGRIGYISSKRLPDIHESERVWQYFGNYSNNKRDYYGNSSGRTLRISRSPKDLQPESIETLEIGYSYFTRNQDVLVDTKIFTESYTKLISQPFSYIDFRLDNEGEATVSGLEIETKYTKENDFPFVVGGVFSYTDIKTNTIEETTLTSEWIASIYAIVPMSDWTLGTMYYHSDHKNRRNYDRFDANIKREFRFADSVLDISLNFRLLPETISTFTEYSNIETFDFGYKNRKQYTFSFSLSF